MKALKILSCNDNRKWYANLIGQCVPLLAVEEKEYKSLEPAGYINFVSKEDAEIVEKRNTKINKNDPLPHGWSEGRKMKFQ